MSKVENVTRIVDATADFVVNNSLWVASIAAVGRLGTKSYKHYTADSDKITRLFGTIERVSYLYLGNAAIRSAENARDSVYWFTEKVPVLMELEGLPFTTAHDIQHLTVKWISHALTELQQVELRGASGVIDRTQQFNTKNNPWITRTFEGGVYIKGADLANKAIIPGLEVDILKAYPNLQVSWELKFLGDMAKFAQYTAIVLSVGAFVCDGVEWIYSDRDAKANDKLLDTVASATLFGLSLLVSWQMTLVAAVAKTAYDYGVSEGVAEQHNHYLCSGKCFIGTGVNTVADWFGGEFEVDSCYHVPVDLVGASS